jgi:hypothetical protein
MTKRKVKTTKIVKVKKEKKKEPTSMKTSIVPIELETEDNEKELEDALDTNTESLVSLEEDNVEPIESLASIDKEEEFTDSDVGTFEDVSSITGEIEEKRPMGKIRPNLPPKAMWSDRVKTKFKTGDLVNISGGTTVFKVVTPGILSHTYDVLASGHNVTSTAKESEMKLAADGSVWRTFWEENDPFRINGIKISCPSNGKLK